MNHLTVDEIIEFVSSNKTDGETMKLMAKVNQHIRRCPECLETVQAFQLVCDEFVRLGNSKELAKYCHSIKQKDIAAIVKKVNDGQEDDIGECADFSL